MNRLEKGMLFDRIIKRYSAYYSGWCVAFGEHDVSYDENREINWIHGDANIGFALTRKLKRVLIRELLGKHKGIPEITLGDSFVAINDLKYKFQSDADLREMEVLKGFFRSPDDIHMFLTSHFCYPPGTKIITFSTRKPLAIMYKEIAPMRLKIT